MSTSKFCDWLGGWAAAFMLVAAALVLAGCHHPSSKSSADAPRARVGAASGPMASGTSQLEPQAFRPGDSVTVTFSDLPVPVQPVATKVKEDGTVTLLQNQTFTFAGKNPVELQKEIRDAYVPKFYKFMTVVIDPERQTLFYYVDGEVKMPARQTYIERTTVLKAIASAGGFTDFAKKTAVKLTRQDGRKFTINCKKAIENPNLDLEVYPGDKVWVPRKLF
jgi:protein involved in polysaccharide export with SLBB domain